MLGIGSAFGWLPPAGTPNKSRQCRSSGSALLSFCAWRDAHSQALPHMPANGLLETEQSGYQPHMQTRIRQQDGPLIHSL